MIASSLGKCFFLGGGGGEGVSYSTSSKLMPVVRYTLTKPSKMPLKMAQQTSRIHCHRLPLLKKYAPEVKAAKKLKRCLVKVKGVDNPA